MNRCYKLSKINTHLVSMFFDSLTYKVLVKGDSLSIGFLLPFIDKVMYAKRNPDFPMFLL